MSQTESPTPSLFRTRLREWQANYKAKLAAESGEVPPPAEVLTPTGQVRVKKLVARKRRKMMKPANSGRS